MATMVEIRELINDTSGGWCVPHTAEYIEIANPANRERIGRVPRSAREDVDVVVPPVQSARRVTDVLAGARHRLEAAMKNFSLHVVAVLASISSLAAQPPQRKPDVVLHGHITYADLHIFQNVPFHVPPGLKRIEVDFTQTGLKDHSVIFSGIADPDGFRGWARWKFFISDVAATPPFLPGPIVPGTWKLILGIDTIRPGNAADWQANIYFERTEDQTDLFPPVVLNSHPGWYRGDLHSHTGHSDGVCTSQSGKLVPCPAFKLVEAAAAHGLDFLAITDHNTPAHFNDVTGMQPYFDTVLLLYGREITTFQGHANVWGTEQFIDFRVGSNGWTVNKLLGQVHNAGGLISINHAYWPYDERCPGCGWADVAHTDFSRIDAIEVINGFNDKSSWFKPPPGDGVPFWEAQLGQGHRITAVGGSDDHRSGELLPVDGVGHPTTVIYADNLSEPALLAGIKAGHVYVKMHPGDPDLFLTAEAGGRTAMMGDNLVVPAATQITVKVETKHGAGDRLAIFEDGAPVSLIADPTVRDSDDTRTFTVAADGKRHWIRVELTSAAGELLALTNPIYFNFK